MMPRGIKQIHLRSNGLVLCFDSNFRQSPSLQGMFHDVKDNILKLFDEDSVRWILVKDNKIIDVSRFDWVKAGEEIGNQPLPNKRIML